MTGKISPVMYLEHCGERFTFPANGYRGDYIAAIGGELFALEGSGLRRGAAEVFKDLPPDEPMGQNPPDGAVIDYYLPSAAGAVTLEIRDGSGAVIRRYASTDPVTAPPWEVMTS